MFKITKIFLIFTLLFNLTSCANKGGLIFETNSNDINKSCLELHNELQYLQTKSLRRIKRTQRLQNVKNVGLIIIAIPTFFTSLLLLNFSDNSEVKEQDIRNRINYLTKLQQFKNC